MKTITGRLILTTLCFVWALAATVPAQADQDTGTMRVVTTIDGSCTVSDAVLNFGNHADTATAIEGQTDFTVNCTYQMPYRVNLNEGLFASGTSRRMRGPDFNYLPYQLYHDAAPHTEVWGTFFGAAFSFTRDGTGAPDMWTVYGQIFPLAPTPPNGVYEDFVDIIVTF